MLRLKRFMIKYGISTDNLQGKLDMDSFWGNIFSDRLKEEGVRSILKKIPVFDGLKDRDLAAIERIMHRREYETGEAIFLQGEPGLGMYIIESGAVEIVSGPLRHMLAELHDGEFFGELALMDDSPRAASAIVRAPTRMLCFLQPDLFDLIDRNPALGGRILLRLARTIGERLKKSNEDVRALREEIAAKN